MTDYRSLEQKIRQLWIDEANRNTEIRRKVANVGRPDDNVKDETSKLAKQGEIKTKIIDEATDDTDDKVSNKKVKKDTEMDDMEAKTIKGGKTEVDTEPKTDDSTENSTDEDKKSKKARNQENKTIGAKGVKEETMLRSDKNHGSSQSLIDAITEALKGKQHKIDANHNGKIDAQDFKILKGKKKVEEETVEEGNALNKEKKREFTADVGKNYKKMGFDGRGSKGRHPEDIKKDNIGLGRKVLSKEEVEELDERDMENKAKKDAAVAGVGAKNRDEKHLGSKGMKTSVADKIRGREKMSGKDRQQFEEVELSAKELARLEEINNNLDEVVTARKLTAADKAAKAKYLAGYKDRLASAKQNAVKGDAKTFKDRNTETGDYTKEPSKMHKTGLLNVLTKQDTKVS
jgi:hypothetical protein